MNVLDMTLCNAVSAVKAGRISSAELVQESLSAITKMNPELQAVIAVQEDHAMTEAKRLDALPPDRRGLLHGVPLAHKDMFDRMGVTSTFGARPVHHRRATSTAGLLRRLDEAGAVSLAALNMAEFAMGPTGHNSNVGRCRNPYDPERITGGSSSGSGAAVSARMVFGALGSDTGGSIRLPAAACGIVGLKPTQDALDMSGVMPLSHSLDCPGPLARTCCDVARLMDVLSGPGHERDIDASVQGVRIGLPKTFYLEQVENDVAEAHEDAVETCRSLGAAITRVDIPPQDMLPHFADILWKSEAAAFHRERLADGVAQLGEQVRARLAQGVATSAVDYLQAQKLRSLALRQMIQGPFAQCDILLIPVMPCPVPKADDVSANNGESMRLALEAISRFTRPISFLGLPSLAMPAGRDRNGMPVGIQLVGRPWSEALLLRIGHQIERTGRHSLPPPHIRSGRSRP